MSSSIRTILTYALLCATVAADTKFNTVISSAEAPTFGALELGLTRHNASGHYPMRGADVSKPFPSNMVDGWKLEIDVAANVPITIGPAKGKYASAVGIWLNPPGALLADNGHGQDELLNAQVDSWYGCMNVFGIKGISGDAGNGTCSGLLSPNCTANIRKALINSAEATEGGRCPNLWNITDIVDSGCPLPEDEYASESLRSPPSASCANMF